MIVTEQIANFIAEVYRQTPPDDVALSVELFGPTMHRPKGSTVKVQVMKVVQRQTRQFEFIVHDVDIKTGVKDLATKKVAEALEQLLREESEVPLTPLTPPPGIRGAQ